MKVYERVKERTLAEWVYFFTDPKITKMPADAEKRAEDAVRITMDTRQQAIFLRRYRDKVTLEAIAKEMGLSKPRIHNILETAAVRLWESETASVILREGLEAGMEYQICSCEERAHFFSKEIVEVLRDDPAYVTELAVSNRKKNITTRLSRELEGMTIGEVVTLSKKQLDKLYGIGDKSKEYLEELIREYAKEKKNHECNANK